MIRADVAFALNRPNAEIGNYMAQCCESLEALGNFAEAASVYQDVVDNYADTIEERATQQGNCALAWKRAEQYERSEEAYVAAFHLLSIMDPLHFDGESTNCALSNVIQMYYEWVRKDNAGKTSMNRLVDSLLLALLHTAGFRPPTTSFSHVILSECGTRFVRMLALQYQSRKAAII